jgi:hypothetical protein
MAMGRWPLLGNRDYMLLWSGEILSELGSQVSTIAYPLLVLGLTHSPAEAGVVGLAKWLPLVLFALPAGALADRVDRGGCGRFPRRHAVVPQLYDRHRGDQGELSGRPRSTTGTTHADGFRWMWSRPFYRAAALLAGAGNPVYTGLYLLAILLARHDGASSAAIGVLFAIVGVGGVLGALAAAPLRRRIATHTLLSAQQWLLAAAVVLLLAAHSALLIGGLLAVAEFLTPAGNAAVGGARVAAAPDHLQGRVQASGTVIAMSFAWAGPLAAGLLFQRAGVTATILSFAALTLVLAVITTLAPALRAGPPAAD